MFSRRRESVCHREQYKKLLSNNYFAISDRNNVIQITLNQKNVYLKKDWFISADRLIFLQKQLKSRKPSEIKANRRSLDFLEVSTQIAIKSVFPQKYQQDKLGIVNY